MACNMTSPLELLRELGFEKAAKKVEDCKELVEKTHKAYQNFEFITKEDVDEFNKKLQNKTLKETKEYKEYLKLVFLKVEDYLEVPPISVLEKLKSAKDLKCFDYFEIAKIESVREVKDPILFGRIKDCGDYFFIAQWDDDVTLEAIKASR